MPRKRRSARLVAKRKLEQEKHVIQSEDVGDYSSASSSAAANDSRESPRKKRKIGKEKEALNASTLQSDSLANSSDDISVEETDSEQSADGSVYDPSGDEEADESDDFSSDHNFADSKMTTAASFSSSKSCALSLPQSAAGSIADMSRDTSAANALVSSSKNSAKRTPKRKSPKTKESISAESITKAKPTAEKPKSKRKKSSKPKVQKPKRKRARKFSHSAEQLKGIWDALDVDKKGFLSAADLADGFERIEHSHDAADSNLTKMIVGANEQISTVAACSEERSACVVTWQCFLCLMDAMGICAFAESNAYFNACFDQQSLDNGKSSAAQLDLSESFESETESDDWGDALGFINEI